MADGLILIADDSQVSRESMANILTAAGYKVIQAIDGGSAMKVIHEHNVLLAIIDHFMAPRGGFDFAKQIQAQKIKLPMIMVTNEETSDLLVETTRHNIGYYMMKPVDPKRLTEAVRRALRQRPGAVEVEAKADVEIDVKLTPEQLMQKAIELADKNAQSRHGGPFGAIVADPDGRIVGQGVNGITSRCDPVAHAEVMAIRQATEALNQSHLEGCTLYSSSEPTLIGKALIESVGLTKVYFGMSHNEVSQLRAGKTRPPVIYQRLGHQAALDMFAKFKTIKEPVKD